MNANPELPAQPDPLTLLAPVVPGPVPVRVLRKRIVEVIETFLYYGILAVGVLIPVGGGIIGLISK